MKKLNVKQKILDAVSSDIIGFLIVLGRNGSVLILNSNGQFVSTIERPETEFTSVSCSKENLYLGTFSGTVFNYHLSSLQLIKQLSHNSLLSQKFPSKHFSSKVSSILTSSNGKRVVIVYESKNFYIYHNRKDSIEALYVAHHSESIKDIKWISQSGKQMLTISDKLCYGRTTNSGTWSFSSVDLQSELLPINF